MAIKIISTSVLIKIGNVYGIRMIDLSVSKDKLLNIAIGILFDIDRLIKKLLFDF